MRKKRKTKTLLKTIQIETKINEKIKEMLRISIKKKVDIETIYVSYKFVNDINPKLKIDSNILKNV